MKIIRDTREQRGQGWVFEGMVRAKLDTGDYSLEGYEDQVCIERKGTSGEFAHNIIEARFERELERMAKYKYAFLILEFTEEDLESFPKFSGIPAYKWPKLRIGGKFIRKRIREIQEKYPTITVLLIGDKGREFTLNFFKEFINEKSKHAES